MNTYIADCSKSSERKLPDSLGELLFCAEITINHFDFVHLYKYTQIVQNLLTLYAMRAII